MRASRAHSYQKYYKSLDLEEEEYKVVGEHVIEHEVVGYLPFEIQWL